MTLPDTDSILRLLETSGVALSKRDIRSAFKFKREEQCIVQKKVDALKTKVIECTRKSKNEHLYKEGAMLRPTCHIDAQRIN